MPTDTAWQDQRPRTSPRHPIWGDLAVLIGAAACAILVGPLVLSEPHRVQVTVVNPTLYSLDVAVAGADLTEWSPILTVSSAETATVTDLADEGARWTFRFAGQGLDAGQLTLTRAQLEQAHWQVEIPTSIGTLLHNQGAPPSP